MTPDKNPMTQFPEAVFHASKSASVAVAFLCLAAVSLTAGARETKLVVTATVLKHASLQVVSQPGSVSVTTADIARGYVDVPVTAKIMVKSNTQDGYLLTFASQGNFFRHAMVRGLESEVQLGPDGGGVAQKATGRGMTRTDLDLGFRFMLSASAQQGVYAWPMRLSVTPL